MDKLQPIYYIRMCAMCNQWVACQLISCMEYDSCLSLHSTVFGFLVTSAFILHGQPIINRVPFSPELYCIWVMQYHVWNNLRECISKCECSSLYSLGITAENCSFSKTLPFLRGFVLLTHCVSFVTHHLSQGGRGYPVYVKASKECPWACRKWLCAAWVGDSAGGGFYPPVLILTQHPLVELYRPCAAGALPFK